MNRTRGVTVGTLVLLGASLLRQAAVPTSAASAPPAEHSAASHNSLSDELGVSGRGPWVASCDYWAAARRQEAGVRAETAAAAKTAAHSGKDVSSRVSQSEPAEHACGNADLVETAGAGADAVSSEKGSAEGRQTRRQWGLPARIRPDITAIIATVPDPERGHLELDFDRSIDAIVAAAEANGFLPSYFWLPWKQKSASGKSAAAGDSAAEDTTVETRMHLPGMLVLKSDDFKRVIYLFLVGETPALGLDGEEFETVLGYERELATMPGADVRFSRRDMHGLSVLGPRGTGSAAALHAALSDKSVLPPNISGVEITGWTSTEFAKDELKSGAGESPGIEFRSFGEDTVFEAKSLQEALDRSHYVQGRVALLTEEGTAFGLKTLSSLSQPSKKDWISVHYPRGISLLRNSEPTAAGGSKAVDTAPSLYLPFSLKDNSKDDTVGHFSPEQTPLSQEARLRAIARELQSRRAQFIVISASNFLDGAFLAEFLHRACPDARLVFLSGADLILRQEPGYPSFIGAIALTPYNLFLPTRELPSDTPMPAFPDSLSEALYNAATYSFWDGKSRPGLPPIALAGYGISLQAGVPGHSVLWVDTVGSDGYYPLGILQQTGSEKTTLPTLCGDIGNCATDALQSGAASGGGYRILESGVITPSLLWFAMCMVVCGMCVAHCLTLKTARYWSATTRDLDIRESDHPRRRAVYVHIGTAMLFGMTVVLSSPVLCTHWYGATLSLQAYTFGVITLGLGCMALFATAAKSARYLCKPGKAWYQSLDYYLFFDAVAFLAVLGIPAIWYWICHDGGPGTTATFSGLFVSYRVLHPESGVSPVVPVVLLLFAWYLWAFFQTCRLRFSRWARPQLPSAHNVTYRTPSPLFVTEEALDGCDLPNSECFYTNVTCLLITRQMVHRVMRESPGVTGVGWLDVALTAIYLSLFVACILIVPFKSMDRFAWRAGWGPTPYEFLMTALFFPLMVITLTGWLRLLVIWKGLRRGVLDALERLPFRGAFTRIKGLGWMSMLQQSGLQEYWRDMSRSTESLRQLVHTEPLMEALERNGPARRVALEDAYTQLTSDLEGIMRVYQGLAPLGPPSQTMPAPGEADLPRDADRAALHFIWSIEADYARAAEALLDGLLLPYWQEKRTGLVEPQESAGARGNGTMLPLPLAARMHALRPGAGGTEEATLPGFLATLEASGKAEPDPLESDPAHIRLAEEFLALRYISLIRAVLVNMRHLMSFVSMAFVLTIVAWNSYPFEPRREIDWVFTGLLAVLGTGVVWVLAQMHRNPLLSRITDTSENNLGGDFWVRLATYGGVPVLTWLAYQFPSVGGTLFRMLAPGLGAGK